MRRATDGITGQHTRARSQTRSLLGRCVRIERERDDKCARREQVRIRQRQTCLRLAAGMAGHTRAAASTSRARQHAHRPPQDGRLPRTVLRARPRRQAALIMRETSSPSTVWLPNRSIRRATSARLRSRPRRSNNSGLRVQRSRWSLAMAASVVFSAKCMPSRDPLMEVEALRKFRRR